MTYIQGKYEATLRDYKKGKLLLETRPDQLLPSSTSSSSTGKDGSGPTAMDPNARASTSDTDAQRKRILEKVWSAVERVMDEMKEVLFGQLRNPLRSVEEQEKTIEYVFIIIISSFLC